MGQLEFSCGKATDSGILFNKGKNEFSVKQLSTGFEDTFTVLGAEIVKKELNSLSAVYTGEGGLT